MNVCIWGLNPACQYGQEPLALARLRLQCSQNTGSRTLRALSGSTLPRWRGAHGATGTAPSQWLLLRKPQKELCDCGARFGAIHRHNACLYLSIRNRNRRVCFSQQWHVERTHTHAHAHRLFVLIIHKQSLNLNSPLTSAAPALLWSRNEFPMIQSLHLHSHSSFHLSDS